jgi:type I restriction enzyme S subunit
VDFVIAQDMVALRADDTVIDPLYLFAALRSPRVQHQIRNLDVSGVIPHFKKSDFDKLLLPYPDRSTQAEVGKLYFWLCSKINLNCRTNETLEATARAVFKDWFVNFGPTRAKIEGAAQYLASEIWEAFPARLGSKGKPEGWHVTILDDVLDELETGGRPKGGVSGFTHGIPSVGAESIVGLGLFDYTKTKYVPPEFYSQMKKGHVRSRDVLLYKDGGRPGAFEPHVTLFGDGFPFDTFAINEHVYRLRAKPHFGQTLLYFWLSTDFVMEEMRIKGTGVAVPGLNSTQVNSLTTLVAPPEVTSAFDQIAEPMIARILANCNEAQTLAKTRDFLLPKLISGEVRIKEAERIAETVL